MTSKWMTRAPASITSSICVPRRPKSAERIEGATRRSVRRGGRGFSLMNFRASLAARRNRYGRLLAPRSYRPQHRLAAVLAGHVLGGAHPRDRLVLAAVGALRDQLEAA